MRVPDGVGWPWATMTVIPALWAFPQRDPGPGPWRPRGEGSGQGRGRCLPKQTNRAHENLVGVDGAHTNGTGVG